MLDLIVKNARIVDGTGNPWYKGDIGVRDGLITGLGYIDQTARAVVDAAGLVASPGFIDGHSHSDLLIMDQPLGQIKLLQGVTTEVVGNCGLAPAPYFQETADMLRQYVEPVIGDTGLVWNWNTVGQFMDALEKNVASENVATYVAHGALRIAAMGFANRPANQEELRRMKFLLEEGLKAGAIGLSIGLLYAPGSYTTKEEIAELCSVLPAYDGLLATHIRGEGSTLLTSISEVIWIAETSEVPLHVCHLKAAGRRNWGIMAEALTLIDQARARGMDVTCDVYPYNASSTMLTTLLPPWVLEGGIDALLQRIKDPAVRRQVRAELAEERKDWDNLLASTGWKAVVVSSVQTEANRHLEGLHMEEIAEMRGQHPAECVMDLLLEEEGKVAMVYFLMSDEDVDQAVQYDYSLVISDSLGCTTGKPHPRLYGAFPRLFARYVRERKLLSLEQAVRKVTSFPVQRFKLGRRGRLDEGYRADIVLFDPERIQDMATYTDPCQYPEGIAHVFVNGVETIRQGAHTHACQGQLIRYKRS
ncbi:N-acyl-D-amino-acid deacylase family protein [Paenibacillus eucommiae]|uniref:N-acyl-D-amino-acid deacylase n=1 Tax=Paenibacillus eucommiae TaxID=1355755 RepID=A0ABS4IZY5_9BACL|nr:D-aminoacylase [Paenibacillus eucommiae]MBP1993154.1 N-acyl-D-amino-acid deacylase [Paenibacillus eucommiae]